MENGYTHLCFLLNFLNKPVGKQWVHMGLSLLRTRLMHMFLVLGRWTRIHDGQFIQLRNICPSRLQPRSAAEEGTRSQLASGSRHRMSFTWNMVFLASYAKKSPVQKPHMTLLAARHYWLAWRTIHWQRIFLHIQSYLYGQEYFTCSPTPRRSPVGQEGPLAEISGPLQVLLPYCLRELN